MVFFKLIYHRCAVTAMNKQMNKDGSHLHNRSPLSPSQNSGRRARRVVFFVALIVQQLLSTLLTPRVIAIDIAVNLPMSARKRPSLTKRSPKHTPPDATMTPRHQGTRPFSFRAACSTCTLISGVRRKMGCNNEKN